MKRVLVVEDNEDNMKLITFILEKGGYETMEARTGEEGIRKAFSELPDFVLLDIQLPDMDGLEVLKALRASEECARTPAIAITSYAMSGDRQRFLQAGCNGYIEKPINPETVMAEIRASVGEE
ncbi:MAG: response regulator [Deltaproteobacteria bacterium]|nr:response regulator [Deltaproteobacteria bacterium]